MITKAESRRQSERVSVADSYLTPREYQIISMYIDGFSQPEIARRLRLLPGTISNQIINARLRVGAKNIHQLIAMVAVSDALKGRGSPSNRDQSGKRVTARATNCVEALTVTSRPELP